MKLIQHPDHPQMICLDDAHHTILGQMHSVQIAELVVHAMQIYPLLAVGITNLLDCEELNGDTICSETAECMAELSRLLKANHGH